MNIQIYMMACSLFAFPVCKMYNLHCTNVLYISYMYCKVLTMMFCMLYNCLYSEQCKHVLYVFYSTHMMFCMTYKCLYSVSVYMYCMCCKVLTWCSVCPTPVYTMYSVHMYCRYCKYSHDVLYALPEIVIQFLFFTRSRYTQTSSTRIYLNNKQSIKFCESWLYSP